MHAAVEGPKAALIWLDIAPYHAARSRAAFSKSRFAVETIEIFGVSGFAEFRAGESVRAGFQQRSLNLPRDAKSGEIRAELWRTLDAMCPVVVFAPGWALSPALMAIEWCAANEVRCVIMSESNRHDEPRFTMKELIKRQIVSVSQAALVGATDAADYMSDLGMPHDRISWGYDIIDNDHFARGACAAQRNADSVRIKLGLPQSYLLFCARLIEKKNHLLFLHAYADARRSQRGGTPSLLLVGPGPLESTIRERVNELGLSEHVILKGAFGYEDLPAIYGLAEGAVLPSVTEQWGLVVNEAMAAGLPVLVSERCGSASTLVEDGGNGFKFDPFDRAAITDALVRFFRLSCAEHEAMGARSKEIIANWGPARFAQGFDAAAMAAMVAPVRKPSIGNRLLLRALTFR